MKILCAGDLHIGRRPSRLPDRVDRGRLSCAHTWSALVDRAVELGVDLVALSGDVVDESNRYYEAIGPLEAGIRRLADRGIRTVAVAGNHDHDVLPWLAETLPREAFTLLGRGGVWERHTIESDGRAALHIDGWSFSDRNHRDDPLRGYALPDPGDTPVLGLLHCDLDQPRSTYAPVQLGELRRRKVGFWLLGHVHAPREVPGSGAHVLYPGSPQAMDPGEPGIHGAWLVEVDAGGRFTRRQIPLASVRYESVEVDVGDAVDPGDVGRRLTDAVRARLAGCVDEGCGPLKYLSLRLRLTGRTGLHRELEKITAAIPGDLEIEHDGVRAVVERVAVGTRPARDLAVLAAAPDAAGELARLILDLETGEPGPEHERLVRQAAQAASDARGSTTYARLPSAEIQISHEATRSMLADAAATLLDELLGQKESA